MECGLRGEQGALGVRRRPREAVWKMRALQQRRGGSERGSWASSSEKRQQGEQGGVAAPCPGSEAQEDPDPLERQCGRPDGLAENSRRMSVRLLAFSSSLLSPFP